MLEYLLLRKYDINQQWRPQLQVVYRNTYTLEGRMLKIQCQGDLHTLVLPVFCFAVREIIQSGISLLLLGNDGREYEYQRRTATFSIYNSWPIDLTLYEDI